VKEVDVDLSQAILGIATTMSGVREQAKVTEEKIHSTIEHLIVAAISMLRDREAALIGDMETVKHQKEKELQLQKEELEFLLSGIRHATLFGEALVKEGSDSEIVAGHRQVVARLTTLVEERGNSQLEPTCESEIELAGTQELTDLLSSVFRRLGDVVAPDLSIELSSIERPERKIPSINRTYTFTLLLIDQRGRKMAECKDGKNGILVAVSGPTKEQVVCLKGSKELDEGQLRVSFIPTSIGEHQVSVTSWGRHFEGSPFSLEVDRV